MYIQCTRSIIQHTSSLTYPSFASAAEISSSFRPSPSNACMYKLSMQRTLYTCTCSCRTLIGVHEMRRMHSSEGLVTVFWPMTPSHHWPTLWSPMHTPLEVGNLPTKTLVARRWPRNNHTPESDYLPHFCTLYTISYSCVYCTYMYIHVCTCTCTFLVLKAIGTYCTCTCKLIDSQGYRHLLYMYMYNRCL